MTSLDDGYNVGNCGLRTRWSSFWLEKTKDYSLRKIDKNDRFSRWFRLSRNLHRTTGFDRQNETRLRWAVELHRKRRFGGCNDLISIGLSHCHNAEVKQLCGPQFSMDFRSEGLE
jgi:hypothetical protein